MAALIASQLTSLSECSVRKRGRYPKLPPFAREQNKLVSVNAYFKPYAM